MTGFRTLAIIAILASHNIWAGKSQQVVLAAGNAITIFRLNEETGPLTAKQEVEVAGAGAFTISPNKKFLYAAAVIRKQNSTKAQQAIATLALLPEGKVSLLNISPIDISPGYLDVSQDGKYLTANSYRNGTISVWRIVDGIFKGDVVQVLELKKKTHSAIFSQTNKWLLAPATEPNKVFVNQFDNATGKLWPTSAETGPTAETAARQPRHLVFHPTLPLAYTTNEREKPGVGVYRIDKKTGHLKPLAQYTTGKGPRWVECLSW